MKVVETIKFKENNSLYRNKQISVREDEEGVIHFFEESTKEDIDVEKLRPEVNIDTIKWCVKNGKLPRSINPFIPLEKGEILETEVFYNYKGTSKKLTTKKVIVLSKTNNRCKVQDMDGNETSVAKSQLTLID